LALYVHWPFCVSKCPYCDFNSHVAEGPIDGRWGDALVSRLDDYVNATKNRPLVSIFFGGGTPSLMEPAVAGRIIKRATEIWPPDENLEVTLEANPSTIDAARLRDFRAAGVNRLSLGVQSFDDNALRFLGRVHDAKAARAAIEVGQGIFRRLNFDLIYARPGQSPIEWAAELDEALAFGPEHLSLYQLTIERGTKFHRGGVAPAAEDDAIALYKLSQERLNLAGLAAYEISNHARPGSECRHNLHVWRGGDYAAVGPGAHGRITVDGKCFAVQGTSDPGRWLAAAEKGGNAAKWTPLTLPQRLDEIVIMGLRLQDGIRRSDFTRLVGATLEEALGGRPLERLIDGDFLVLDGAGLRATAAARLRLNTVIGDLLGG
jgi:oxygen-independent coproporphyrinogen-3 oxidase